MIQTLKSLFPNYAHDIESSWAPIYSATQPFTCKRQNADIIWKTNKRIINRESCPGCISDHKEEDGLKTTFHENGTPLILPYLQKHFGTNELEIAGAGTPLERDETSFRLFKVADKLGMGKVVFTPGHEITPKKVRKLSDLNIDIVISTYGNPWLNERFLRTKDPKKISSVSRKGTNGKNIFTGRELARKMMLLFDIRKTENGKKNILFNLVIKPEHLSDIRKMKELLKLIRATYKLGLSVTCLPFGFSRPKNMSQNRYSSIIKTLDIISFYLSDNGVHGTANFDICYKGPGGLPVLPDGSSLMCAHSNKIAHNVNFNSVIKNRKVDVPNLINLTKERMGKYRNLCCLQRCMKRNERPLPDWGSIVSAWENTHGLMVSPTTNEINSMVEIVKIAEVSDLNVKKLKMTLKKINLSDIARLVCSKK